MAPACGHRPTFRRVSLPPGEKTAPGVFERALEELHTSVAQAGRPGTLVLDEVPAPRRLAPYSAAFVAALSRDGREIGTGRFVVLHDPAGQPGWQGATRVVAYVSAALEPEMAGDPVLAEIGWSWLQEALSGRAAAHTAAGGTVTRTASLSFGLVDDAPESGELEIRASWTPLPEPDGSLGLGAHLRAWCDLLCSTAGLPPAGVTELRSR